MTNENFEELCSAYVLNSLDDSTASEFSIYLKTANQEEKRFYSQLLICKLQLPLSVKTIEPPRTIKTAIINAVSKPKTNNTIFSLKTTIYAAAAVVIAVFAVDLLMSESSVTNNQLLSNGIMLITNETELPKTFCHSAENISMVSNSVKSESAKLIWCPYHKIAFLQINQISDLSENQSYQVWMEDSEGESVSIGVLSAHRNMQDKVYNIRHLVKLKPSANHIFSVTIEVLNGAKKSVGKPYLIST